MRNFLLILLVWASWLFADDDFRGQFLKRYYDGDYVGAHAILKKAFSDPRDVQVWEERVHLQKAIDGCDYVKSTNEALRGLALLHIGEIEEAKKKFAEDVPSFLGLATLATWQNDGSSAHSFIQRGLQKAPDDPEFLFFAGNLAETDEEAIDYFQRYLSKKPSDELKVLSAQQAIDFVNKTHGVPLNIANMNGDSAQLDSRYETNRVILKASVNGKSEVNLLVDTGAAGISLEKGKWEPKISSDLLMIGLGKTQKVAGQRVVFDTFSAGQFQIRNPVAAISDTLNASGIDGIIGSVVFSKYAILLPMHSQKSFTLITQSSSAWLEQNGAAYQTRVTFPFYCVNKMMIVKGSIKKSAPDMDMLIDTGAFRSILAAPAAHKYAYINYPLSRMANQKPELFGLGGRIEDLLLAENVELKIGTIQKEFRRITVLNLGEISEALELEVDAILGRDFLDGYTLLIDYRNDTITFLK